MHCNVLKLYFAERWRSKTVRRRFSNSFMLAYSIFSTVIRASPLNFWRTSVKNINSALSANIEQAQLHDLMKSETEVLLPSKVGAYDNASLIVILGLLTWLLDPLFFHRDISSLSYWITLCTLAAADFSVSLSSKPELCSNFESLCNSFFRAATAFFL